MILLSTRWAEYLKSQPETGMGYQICTIELIDKRTYKQVVIDSGYITKIRNIDGIPFNEEDIENITVTHEKWNWKIVLNE